jgi:hypothetical protein
MQVANPFAIHPLRSSWIPKIGKLRRKTPGLFALLFFYRPRINKDFLVRLQLLIRQDRACPLDDGIDTITTRAVKAAARQ